MAQQEGGWPLGLQPVNVRIGLVRNVGFSGSHSFRTLITASPSSSSSSSSGLDTESTGSFFHDRSSTLGSLIGITSILDLSNRSLRRSRQQENPRANKNRKTKTWFSLCARTQLSGDVTDASPSLGSFLEAERRASNARQVRNGVSITYVLEGLAESRPAPEPNTVFSDGLVLPPPPPPPPPCPQSGTHAVLGLHSGHCFALMFPCVAAQSTE
ncbi:unnamed protein product [Musa acuminata subsp. malaccensis]|uniref:(wild Malaysian banana) hypothetical protein n=1 Tax=Musa acuminata subsp. malaccensis TaxID=214687 RepID=A0A804KRP2_MUSAM|nr:PREDICTED: uncharacterized protein At3g17950-like [Musa acuminata subsp. malaccensis]CAG1852252.1 unnamed protein product [Musa acuminata subsp. malaccensis]